MTGRMQQRSTWKGFRLGTVVIATLVVLSAGPAVARGFSGESGEAPAEKQTEAEEFNEIDDDSPDPRRDYFLSDPLRDVEPDPLLPPRPVARPLTPLELREISEKLDGLRLEGEDQLLEGNKDEAFDIWLRELRLRRVLGLEAEVDALGEVGETAWRESRTDEVRLITERLQQIQAIEVARVPRRYDQLEKIALAFRELRAREPALEAYGYILEEARRRGDVAAEEKYLRSVADLHLSWFRYDEAAVTYQALLQIAREQRNPARQAEYLRQLGHIHTQNKQPKQAITYQQQLIRFYEKHDKPRSIPALQLAIANHYRALGEFESAAIAYREAYTTANASSQFGYASDALRELAVLYETLERWDDVLFVYQLLIDVEQNSYSAYGIMAAYDRMGQIHWRLNNRAEAVLSFRNGLAISRQLKYKERYFLTQIDQVIAGQPFNPGGTEDSDSVGEAPPSPTETSSSPDPDSLDSVVNPETAAPASNSEAPDAIKIPDEIQELEE